MALLDLTPDELLATTRAVRKRLDFDRPLAREVLEECLALATQAPSGSNQQGWHFVVVTDPAIRLALADLYRQGWEFYKSAPFFAGALFADDPERAPTQQRVAASAQYLADNMHRAPALLVPCIEGRTDGQPALFQASVWGSILPAAWSFMLAARARGLGTSWTTLHLIYEEQAAELLGIPFETTMQTALIPVAHTRGTDFKPAPRVPLDRVVHWDSW
ncbi:MAG: nitroreductase family protein [Acidimicrobiales bacterium]|nr:nitroreductase family protein [Acidimicrobiales bacterium]